MKKTKKTIFSALSVAALSLCAAGVFGLNAAEKRSANAEANAVANAEAGAEESTQTSFAMLGASIRYITDEDSNSGIRFGISMSKTEWETYRAKTSLETGIILIPETVIGNKTEITLSTEKAQINATYNDAINAWNEDPKDNTLVSSTVVLTKIPVNDYNNVIWARGYLKYTEDGAEKVVYTETMDRSIDEVAYQLLKTETDATKKAALQAYLDANEYTVTIKDEIGNIIDSQVGKYGDPLKTPQKISDDDAVYQFTSWKEENAGYIKGNAEYVAKFNKVTAFENVKVTITDAAAYGLNGVEFTLTNKANAETSYTATVKNGELNFENVKVGTYSVKAVLIPGTTTTGADITINDASLNYNASSMFRGGIKSKSATSVTWGENNSFTMPSGKAMYGSGTVVDAISGNVFIGTKIKFTNDEMVAMINSGTDSGLGIAMFTTTGDTYTGIQFKVTGGWLTLRTMQNWEEFVTLGTVTDNNFTVTATESDWIAVANAIVGDGIYLVQQKGTDNKLTYYFYNADKTTLLKKYETGFAYAGSDTICGIGTYRWNPGFAYTVSDFRVSDSLAGALNRANEDVEITQTAKQCNIATDKTSYKIGDTVKLTITPSDAENYPIFASLKINGVEYASSATTDESGNKVYSFVAYDKQITVEAEYTDKLNANITITDAAAYGLNGVAFTLTNKSNSSIVYNVTVADGKLAIPNAEIGTYSVSAVLIPGTTTTGADLELKQETLTYNAEALIFNPRLTETCNVQFGENNSLTLGSSSELTPHIGAKIKNLAGEFYVGNLFKFTKEQLTNAFNAQGAVGLALYTGENEYFGLNIVAGGTAFYLRVLGDWREWYTETKIGDFSSGSYQDDTNHLAAALTGDGIYGVLHRADDGKVTLYLYNAAKTSLLLKVETKSTKTKAVYGIAAGYWDNKTENRFDCEYSDIRVGTSLAALGVTAE